MISPDTKAPDLKIDTVSAGARRTSTAKAIILAKTG